MCRRSVTLILDVADVTIHSKIFFLRTIFLDKLFFL